MSTRNVVISGKAFTTAYVFIHMLRRLVGRGGDAVADVHFHLVLDDQRDAAYARSVLPAAKITVYAEYETLDPFRRDRTWSPDTVTAWERLYGDPNLRRYMDQERILAGLDEAARWRYLLAHIEHYERIWRETQPILYVCGAASTLPPWVAMTIFKRRGVPVVSFYPTRFGTTSFILDGPYERLDIGPLYRELLATGLAPEEEFAARAVVDAYRQEALKPIDYLYVNAQRMRALPSPLRALRAARDAYRTDQRYYDEPFSRLAVRSLTARRTWLYDAWLRRRVARRVDRTEPFFFFPLQFEPEMSLITQGREWHDQLEVIRLISQSLPIDRWLYVKEHPNMPAGARSLAFYRELVRLPRVRILDRRINSDAIVPFAEAVLTITSTAGWEALMFDRPVVLFGHAFYEEFEEGVLQVKGPSSVPHILRTLRDHKSAGDAILAYLAAVLRRSVPGIIIEPRHYPEAAPLVLSDTNLDALGRVVLDAIA